MSFFSKMKERLNRSSSKIDEGLQAIVEDDTAVEPPKVGVVGRMLGRDAAPKRVLDDAMLESLEELLITTDMGVETALKVSANMAEGRFGKKLGVNEIKSLLADEVKAILE
ncbi:MAG: signal recognition particle receptor subunit alpha, partial [Marinosulfonomonas sp.]|nr:signal recognition particle receptor subunit alpha [Marinosulfonomonas sp.]